MGKKEMIKGISLPDAPANPRGIQPRPRGRIESATPRKKID
jgi:hypothetical protein